MTRHLTPIVVYLCDDVPFAHAPPEDTPWSAAPLDVEDLADLICDRPLDAAASLARLTLAQRRLQALCHAAWLHACGLSVTPDEIAASYDVLIREHIQPDPPAQFANLTLTGSPGAGRLLRPLARSG